MSEELPYLPDILEGVTERVSDFFKNRENVPFEVFFDYGIYAEVSKSVYKRGFTDPLVWLVMRYQEDRGKKPEFYATVDDCELIIAMPSSVDYSMKERTDNIFKPFLIPIYDQLLYEISMEDKLLNRDVLKIEHKRRDRPYWGGGEENSINTRNLFKDYVEAIHITNLKLNIEHIRPKLFTNII